MDDSLLEQFDGSELNPRLSWLNAPERVSLDPARQRLIVQPNAGTDFWQKTHYGFQVDNGHFLYLRARGDFVLTTQVSGDPANQYDQAGLMLRLSAACWLKTSVEFEPHEDNRLGAVVTNHQHSDWSTQAIPKHLTTFWFRVRAEGEDCIVESSLDGERWQQLRIAHLTERAASESIDCGLYACSPRGAGYRAEFHFLSFEPGRLR
jgi:regulation of enolase protein 1 (concanavalin A-like superfamily)